MTHRRSTTISTFQDLRHVAEARVPTHGAQSAQTRTVGAVGMNTVGLLCDRLTVLAMKEWVLQNRQHEPAKAKELRETQINELLNSLAEIRPGYSSFTQKISPLKFDSTASNWEEAYYGLLSTNILLWEAQEVLYAGRIDELECAELRQYIAWFSEGNILRNDYIAKCELLFWGDLAVPAGSTSAGTGFSGLS